MAVPRTFLTQNVEWQARLQGVKLASFRSRALAFAIDLLIIGAGFLVVSLADHWRLGTLRAGEVSVTTDGLVSFVATVAYFAVATYLGKGSTVGKAVMGIRVVSIVHSHMSLWHCIERALGYAASMLEAGFGFVQYFMHPNHQTVHDRIAETIVIVKPRRAVAAGA